MKHRPNTYPAAWSDLRARQRRRVGLLERAAIAFAALAMLAGCGKQQGWPNDSATISAENGSQITPEQKKAAAALSITNWAAPAGQSKYQRAVECAAALDAIARALNERTQVGTSEIQQVRRAGATFEARVQSLASNEGLTSAQATTRIANAKVRAGADIGQSSRVAITCVRDLTGQS